MKSFLNTYFWGAIAAAVFLSVSPALAQRKFNVSIARTNDGVIISWRAQSATPIGDLFLIPQFQVERSRDLMHWTPMTGNMPAVLGQSFGFVDTNADQAFYRVQSIIFQEYAQLSFTRLDFGQLTGADFFGAELFGSSLQQAALNGSEFAAADIEQVDFTGSDLRNSDFFAVFAISAVFDQTSLSGSDLSFGDFESASFANVNLTGVDFSSATLTLAVFDFAFFKDVKLDANTLIDPKPKLIWQIVNQGATNATLTNLDLSLADFTGSTFNGARLSGSDFSGSVFLNADVRGANFTNANMRFVDLRGSLMDVTTVIDTKSRLVWQILNQDYGAGRDLHGTNLTSVFLATANFLGANLTNTVCSGSIWELANFGNASLFKANCSGSDFFGAIFTNANLTQCNFSSSDLTSANLRNAITNGATFSGATFGNTIMPDGSIRNF